MAEYVGLDVSMKETAVSIRRDGKRIWRGKCGSDPRLIAEVIRRRAPRAARVVFETGPLSVWFYHALTAEGLPAICIDARHAKAALDTRTHIGGGAEPAGADHDRALQPDPRANEDIRARGACRQGQPFRGQCPRAPG